MITVNSEHEGRLLASDILELPWEKYRNLHKVDCLHEEVSLSFLGEQVPSRWEAGCLLHKHVCLMPKLYCLLSASSA